MEQLITACFYANFTLSSTSAVVVYQVLCHTARVLPVDQSSCEPKENLCKTETVYDAAIRQRGFPAPKRITGVKRVRREKMKNNVSEASVEIKGASNLHLWAGFSTLEIRCLLVDSTENGTYTYWMLNQKQKFVNFSIMKVSE